MALNDVLSAMRELILDAEDETVDSQTRRSRLEQRFPTMSATELDELMRVPPERIAVYTEAIFAGQRSMLRWSHPMSMAAIGRMLYERDKSQPEGHHLYDLMREMHRHGPWRSHSVRGLARGFETFVMEGRQDLIDTWPGLADLLTFERTEVDVFYAADEAVVGLQPQAWGELSVEAFLMQPVVVPAYVALFEARFEIVALRDSWNADEPLPDKWPVEAQTFCACGRDPETLRCRWISLDAASFNALSSIKRGAVSTVNDLAGAWLAAQPEGAFDDESAAFTAFCEQLADWARGGIVMAPSTD